MSTTIYDGMIAVDTNPFVVQKRIKEIMEPIFYQKFTELQNMLEAATGKTWGDVFSLPASATGYFAEWKDKVILGKHSEIEDLYKLIVKIQDYPLRTFSETDIAYETLLIPNGRGLDEPPLVLLFSDRAGNEYRGALLDAGVVRKYGYWNNTDEPEDMSAEEWAERKAAWDDLDVPSQDGLSIAMPSSFETVWARG